MRRCLQRLLVGFSLAALAVTILGLPGVASPKTDWSPLAAFACPRGFNLVLVGAASLVLLFVALSGLAARLALHPRPLEPFVRSKASIPSDYETPFETFDVRVRDGVRLHGWWMPSRHEPVRGTIIGLVGVASPKTDWSPFVSFACPHGFHVALYDARGHGESEEAQVTWGVTEALDLSDVLDALALRGYPVSNVTLVGTSVGAVTALRAAARDPRVRAVVAQSAFTSSGAAFDEVAHRWLGPAARLFMPLVRYWVNLVGRPRGFLDVSLLEDLPQVRVPTMIVQGSDDRVVRLEHARRIFETVGSADKEFVPVPGGGHVSLWKRPHPEYHDKLRTFLDRASVPAESSGLAGAPGSTQAPSTQ